MYFPLSLQSVELTKGSSSDSDSKYILTAVLLHTGSASGGHYRALLRDGLGSSWTEHNDADVRIISKAEESNLFWFHSDGHSEPSPTSTALDTRSGDLQGDAINDSVYEGAYVLMYQREDVLQMAGKVDIPAAVMDAVAADNAELDRLRMAYSVYNKLTSLHVTVTGVDAELSSAVTVELPADCLLSEATRAVYEAVATSRVQKGPPSLSALPDASLCRIRRFERSCLRFGETFGGKDSESLATLGLGVDLLPSGGTVRVPEGCSVALEFRKPEDSFVEFTGREMQLRLTRWALTPSNTLEEAESSVVIVPGEDGATVAALRAVAASALQFSGGEQGSSGGVDASRLLLMKDSDRGPVVLSDDSKLLRKDHRVYSGGEVYVEYLPADIVRAEVENGSCSSPVLAALINRKQMIQVFYNVPCAAGIAPEYTRVLDMPWTSSLSDFKEKAARSLVSEGLIAPEAEFHIRRSATGVQIKSEKKTMEDLGITNQSILHLQVTTQL